MSAAEPCLTLEGVGRRFGEVTVLAGLDLTVRTGEYVAIVGPSGSGKSTLLNILGCLDRPSTGRYRLAGVETTELGDSARAAVRARHIGFVFQSFHLLGQASIEDNVALAEVYRHRSPGCERRTRRARAVAELQRVGLGHRLGYRPGLLSGGERQRVAIARALLARPAVLLCDEPTGNLDRANTAAVLDLFDELRTERTADDQPVTIVVITHDDAVAARAERRLRMLDGALEEGL